MRVCLAVFVLVGFGLVGPATAERRATNAVAATRLTEREATWLKQWLHLLPDGTRVNVAGLRDGRMVVTDLERGLSYTISDLNLSVGPTGTERRYRLTGRYATGNGGGDFALNGQAQDPRPDPQAPTGKRLSIRFEGEIRPVLMADMQPYLAIPGASLFGERFSKALVRGRTEASHFRETRVTLHGTNAGDLALSVDGPVNRPRVSLPSDSPLGGMLESLMPPGR